MLGCWQDSNHAHRPESGGFVGLHRRGPKAAAPFQRTGCRASVHLRIRYGGRVLECPASAVLLRRRAVTESDAVTACVPGKYWLYRDESSRRSR
jgi:hypothetical protein